MVNPAHAVPGAGAGVAAAQAAIARAIKASGILVQIEPEAFVDFAAFSDDPLIVRAKAGWRKHKLRYLMPYRGLAFYCDVHEPLQLPSQAHVIDAMKIWVPE